MCDMEVKGVSPPAGLLPWLYLGVYYITPHNNTIYKPSNIIYTHILGTLFFTKVDNKANCNVTSMLSTSREYEV